MEKHITTPITQKITKDLRSGDYVYITGENVCGKRCCTQKNDRGAGP